MIAMWIRQRVLLWSIFIALGSGASAAEPEWHTYSKAPSHISIEYRVLERGHIEIKAERTISSSIGAFLHMLEDVRNIDKWVDRAESATILARPQPRKFVVLTRFHGSFLVADRSMITQSDWQQDPSSLTLVLTVEDVSQDYPVKPNAVMMQDVQATWELTPIDESKLTIRYIGSAHPGGSLPLFLARSQALRSMLKTFKNLPNAIANYQIPYPDVLEPN